MSASRKEVAEFTTVKSWILDQKKGYPAGPSLTMYQWYCFVL